MVETSSLTTSRPLPFILFTASLFTLFYIFLYSFFTFFTFYQLPVFLSISPDLFGATRSHLVYTTPTDSFLVPMLVLPSPHVYHFSCMAYYPNMKKRVAGSFKTLTNINEATQCTTHMTTTFKLFSFHITIVFQKLTFTFCKWGNIYGLSFLIWMCFMKELLLHNFQSQCEPPLLLPPHFVFQG
jgi:hypothetical protein